MTEKTSPVLVAALYKFARLPDFAELQVPLQDACNKNGVKGTLLLAEEGINGTIAGEEDAVREVLVHIQAIPELAALSHKESWADEIPFYRMKVRQKKEIVTMGVEGIDPNHTVGTYVKPQDWNDLISDPDVVVIDTRNDYEVGIGSFANALNPATQSFREFPAWASANIDRATKPKVAMFCTGGIRCEKATAYMKQQGFDEVYHLDGGILKYLETIPEEESLWRGECFVFDHRVSVGHGLAVGSYDLCYGCRRPIDKAAQLSDKFVPGVCCPHCHEDLTEDKRTRFATRQQQIDLAIARGEEHLGAPQNGKSDV